MGNRGPLPQGQSGRGSRRLSFPAGLPPAPERLNDRARQVYAEAAQMLDDAGTGQCVDWGIVVVYAEAMDEYEREHDALLGEGAVIHGPKGAVQKNPRCDVRDKAATRIKGAAEALGFTPVARMRIKAPEKKKEPSAMDEFRD